MTDLLRHQWKKFRRSGSFGRELGFSIIIGIIFLYAFSIIYMLSASFPEIIPSINTEAKANPIHFFNRLLLYYFISELFIRYLVQNIPALDIQPYLYLPIKKSKMVNFLLGKSILHPINLLLLLLVIPFSKDVVMPEFGTLTTICWVSSLFVISLSIHFFNILFKKKLEENLWVWLLIILAIAANFLSYTYFDLDFTRWLSKGLNAILIHPSLFLLPLAILIIMTGVTKILFTNNFYLEALSSVHKSKSENYSAKLLFLSNYGISGQLILEEIRMIIRHKRTRSVLIMSVFFLGYGFLAFGRDNSLSRQGIPIFVGIFISGIFAINYGQFLWSWHTNQLDFFFTRPFTIHDWVKSRYQLLTIASVICIILSLPYAYFGWEVALIIISCGLYNVGINIPLMIRLALWGPKAIDINRSAFMNYEGTGAAQWLMSIPVLLGPFIIYTPLNILFDHTIGIIGVGIVGLISLLFRKYFIQHTAHKINSMKHQLIHDLTI